MKGAPQPCAARSPLAGRRRRPGCAAARARGCRAPPARPRTGARRASAASHTDSMSTAIAPPACSSARRSPTRDLRDADQIADAHLHAEPRQASEQLPREVAVDRAPRGGLRRWPRRPRSATITSPGTDSSSRPPQKPSTSSALLTPAGRAPPRPPWPSRAPCRSCARARPGRPRRSARPPRAAAPRRADRSSGRPGSDRRRGGRCPLAPPSMPSDCSATAAAWCPLSTALSSVAGQPVSVQDPASASPAMAVRAFGRSAATPGAALNVAACSRVTWKRSTAAPRVPAAEARSAPAGSARAAPRRSSPSPAPHRTATRPDTDTPGGAPAAAPRSNRYCTGVPTPAANGCSQTTRS